MLEAGDDFVTSLILKQGAVEHVINVINKSGKIYFIDAQIGKIVELHPNVKLNVGRP